MAISLGRRLLDASSSPPGSREGADRYPGRAGRNDALPSRPASCLTLHLVGFAEPSRSPGLLVSSYLAVSPLPDNSRGIAPASNRSRRFTFCCTFPGLAAGGRYPSPCPAVPGLSSRPTAGIAEAPPPTPRRLKSTLRSPRRPYPVQRWIGGPGVYSLQGGLRRPAFAVPNAPRQRAAGRSLDGGRQGSEMQGVVRAREHPCVVLRGAVLVIVRGIHGFGCVLIPETAASRLAHDQLLPLALVA